MPSFCSIAIPLMLRRMANNDPFSALRGAAKAAFFEPYARLVQVLYPRARGVIFYDAAGKMVWQKDAEVEGTLSEQVRALVREAADPDKNRRSGSERLLNDSTPAYLLWLRDERDAPLGILGVTCKAPAGRTPAATIGEVEKTLQPLLQCVARELATLSKLPSKNTQDQTASKLQQFEWLADKALPLINSTTSTEPLRELLAALVSRTDSALGAVVVPDSSIRVIVESPGWSGETAKDALRRAHRQVLSWVQLERRTFLSSRPFKQDTDRDPDEDSLAGLPPEPVPEVQPAKDSGSLSYHVIATPILQRPDHPIGYVALLRSPFASEFGDAEQQLLERISPLIPTLVERDYDSMTNLRSAAGLERAMRSLPTTESTGASVIFFDIVGLSTYNRERGAPEADRLIRHVAKILRAPQLPEAAISARLGGGHFACLLPRHDAELAQEVAQRVREAAGKQNPAKRSTDPRVVLRSGVAAVTPTAAGLRYALVSARAAATPPPVASSGGARSTAIQASAVQHDSSRVVIPVRLREALRDNRLKLFAQPMRPVRDPSRPVRLELLPRIMDERGKLIAPVEFLSTGSDRDAITELDRWVMSAALTAIAARSSSPGSRNIEVSLNISPRSLEISDFHDWMAEQLRRNVLPAEQWLFEVAETTAANHGRDVARFAKRMLRAGARIVIDNVGGAACGRLQAHGASSIKMDGTLLKDVVKDVRAQRLVEALAQWATASRMDTVAAQVESEQVRDWLVQLGIDYIQGYVVSKPQPIEDVLNELLGTSSESVLFGS
jgi:EAL domain-containing protein (putative c-di-GMP-specific phosphodiesterase class I)/GGDEF domain-containing protein